MRDAKSLNGQNWISRWLHWPNKYISEKMTVAIYTMNCSRARSTFLKKKKKKKKSFIVFRLTLFNTGSQVFFKTKETMEENGEEAGDA